MADHTRLLVIYLCVNFLKQFFQIRLVLLVKVNGIERFLEEFEEVCQFFANLLILFHIF